MESLYSSTINIIPELILIIAGLILLIFGPFFKSNSDKNLVLPVSISAVVLSFIFNLNRLYKPTTAFSESLSLDYYSAFFNSIFLIGLLITILLTIDYIKTIKTKYTELYSLLLFATTGMMFLCSSTDFMTLFLSFEIMSISVYVLTAINRQSSRSTESGIKYLILGGFSSAILLFGIAFIYGSTGSIIFNDILKAIDFSSPATIFGATLIMIAFIFKIGAFPLHQWVPDIYEGAPTTITAYMSVGVKAAAFAVLLRVFFEAFGGIETKWLYALWLISVFTVTIGNISAIIQHNLKRMLAYSSIAHAGYALIGITSTIGDNNLALGSVTYYLFAYTFMNLGAFGVLAYLSKEGKECETYTQISGLWHKKPLIALSLTIFMLSLAGMPPLLGFFAKYRIFLSAINSELYWLAVIGILNSVISAYYYLKVIAYMYMSEEKVDFPSLKLSSAIVILLISLINILLGIFPAGTWDYAVKAANSLLF